MNDELYHYGILGMKWGVRRYQNSDGTRTAAGKARYGSSNKWFDRTVKRGKDKEKISPAEQVLKDTESIVTKSSDVVDRVSSIKNRRDNVEQDLSQFSDEELRQAINRMNLEKQYNQLTAKDVSAGMEYTKDILSIAGSIAAIAVSAVSIYSTVKGMKK